MVSLQAQKALDQRVPANRAVTIKTTTPGTCMFCKYHKISIINVHASCKLLEFLSCGETKAWPITEFSDIVGDLNIGLELDVFVPMFCVCFPEPPEYEARDISVRVLSAKSVLISWVDPAVEMGKVAPGASRWDLLKCVCACVCQRNRKHI